jgi:hypothetical protein
MAPFFNIRSSLLPKMLFTGSREAPDAVRGVGVSTLTSLMNRANNSMFGPSGDWLNPGQYEVLKTNRFNPQDPAIQKAQAYYSTPKGQQELIEAGRQLGGVTDFRGTRYLSDTGNLLKYGTNLIPTTVGGQRRFVNPSQLKALGAKPDFGENTFFNEVSRPPTNKWWEQNAATNTQQPATPPPPISAPPPVNAVLSSLGLVSPGTEEKKNLAQEFALNAIRSVMQIPSALPTLFGTIP